MDAVQHRVNLPDGDAIVVHDDRPGDWQPGHPAALLMHGLGGCSASPLLVRLARKLSALGVRVFRMDLRGCGAGVGLARYLYHAGRSDDLAHVVDAVLGWCDANESADKVTPLTLFGVSLSGNILLKYLGEDPPRVPSQVVRAIAVNPPIDLARSVGTLSGTINRCYDRHFVESLWKDLTRHFEQFPEVRPPRAPQKPATLYQFDDWYTAPMGGFRDAADYYARNSASQFLARIACPTTILTSTDDPMVPVEMFRTARSNWPAALRLSITNGGGHVGYLARRGIDPDRHWLDWRIVEFVTGGSTGGESRSAPLR